MSLRIELQSVEDSVAVPHSGDSTAPQIAAGAVTLRFGISASDGRSLEALRYARRAMLREEWTLGGEADAPSLGDAVFSATEVVWSVAIGQRAPCEARIAELSARANRALREIGGS